MNYGLPYKGSKNAIAKRLVDALPEGENFVDCCCGGGAILQAAVMSGKYKTVTGYDINRSIINLIQAVMIDFDRIDYEKKQLVRKEQFYESRDNGTTLDDDLNRYIASFGFNGMEFLWGEARLKFKYLMQQAISLPTVEERRNALRDFMTTLCKERDKLTDVDFKNLCHLEQATNLARFAEIEGIMKGLKGKTKLAVKCSSMFDIPFEKYDVIYFDPPYTSTKGYNGKYFSNLMFTALLNVLVNSGKKVFVSEYDAPAPEFIEVWSVQKRMTQDAWRNTTVTEKLFYGGTKDEYENLQGISAPDDTGDNAPVQCDTDGGLEQVDIGIDEAAPGSSDTTGYYQPQQP